MTEKHRYKVNPPPIKRHATSTAVIEVDGVATRKASTGPNRTPFLVNPIATGSEARQHSGKTAPARDAQKIAFIPFLLR